MRKADRIATRVEISGLILLRNAQAACEWQSVKSMKCARYECLIILNTVSEIIATLAGCQYLFACETCLRREKLIPPFIVALIWIQKRGAQERVIVTVWSLAVFISLWWRCLTWRCFAFSLSHWFKFLEHPAKDNDRKDNLQRPI